MLASLQLLGPGGSVSRVLHDPQRLLVRGKGSVAQVLRAWERGGTVRSSQLRGHTGASVEVVFAGVGHRPPTR